MAYWAMANRTGKVAKGWVFLLVGGVIFQGIGEVASLHELFRLCVP